MSSHILLVILVQIMLNIGFWNVHGLGDMKIEDEFFNTLSSKFDVIGFVETMKRQSSMNIPGYLPPIIVNSKKSKKRGRNSGGIMIYFKHELSKKFSKISQTDDWIWFKIDQGYSKVDSIKKHVFVCFCYIKPYQNKDTSEEIYSKLENEITHFHSEGELLICGDFNARTGGLSDFIQHDTVQDNFTDCPLPPDYEQDMNLMRNHLDCKSNLHGKLLTDICKTHKLRILNGRFIGDSLGNFTFFNSNGASTVDYMMASNHLFHKIMFFNVKPPCELSDHCLLHVGIKLAFDNTVTTREQCDVKPLKGKYLWSDQCKDAYIDALLDVESTNNILHLNKLLDNENCTNVNDLVNNITQIYINAANKTVPLKILRTRKKGDKPKRKPWMSNNCIILRREVRKLGKKLLKFPKNPDIRQSFAAHKREYNKLRKGLRNAHFLSLSNKINCISPKNSKEFWKNLNECKARDGFSPESASSLGIGDFVKHYKNLLCKEDNSYEMYNDEINKLMKESPSPLDYPFTYREIKEGISKLKSSKTAGPDMILNEFIKVGSSVMNSTLIKLFNKVLQDGQMPETWNLSFISSLYKAGDVNNTNNYRGLSVSSCLGKLFNGLLNRRLNNYLEENNLLSPHQSGFRKNHRTSDNIFIMKTLVNKYIKCKKHKLFVCYVDFRKAYDYVWRSAMILKLLKKGIGGNFAKILQNMYSSTKCACKDAYYQSESFYTNIGVKQGDNLSPTLFNIFIDDFQEYLDVKKTEPAILNTTLINHLFFADDLILISESSSGLQHCLNGLQNYCKGWKLDVNLEKTKVMIFSKKKGDNEQFRFYFGRDIVEITYEYKYLGLIFTSNGSLRQASANLEDKARKAYYSIKSKIPFANNLSVQAWLKMYQALVLPIITYSSEIWITDFKIDIGSQSKLPFEKIQNCILKDILGVHKKASNIAVLSELGLYPLHIKIYESMFKYYHRLRDMEFALKYKNPLLIDAFKEDEKLFHIKSCPSMTNSLSTIIKMIGLSSLEISYKTFSDKLRNYYENKISNQFDNIKQSNSGKLVFYSQIYNYDFKLQEYLKFTLPKTCRSLLSKLRLSAHPLNIEVGRYCIPPIPRSDRFCKFCLNEVEDEQHFLLFCTKYNHLRSKYSEHLGDLNANSIKGLVNPEDYISAKHLCQYLNECFDLRYNDLKKEDSNCCGT